MSRAIPLLPLYAFMEWTGDTTFILAHSVRNILRINGDYFSKLH
jgi:hypothetical protein